MADGLFVWTAAYQICLMRACVPSLLDQRLVSMVRSVFDQTCFNYLATQVNISMFGHQTMFDGVWRWVFGRQTFPVCTGLKAGLNLKF